VKKILTTGLALFFVLVLVGCDISGENENNGNENDNITTLTIRNESSHDIIDISWNNVTFVSDSEVIRPGASVTKGVTAGSGFVRFRPSSNFLRLRSQQLVSVTEGAKEVFFILSSTVAVKESDGSSGTFASMANEPMTLINWMATPVGSPTTTAINFTFTSEPESLTVSNFSIISDSGSATRGTLSGSGTTRTLNVSNVSAGTVQILIEHPMIASEPQTVTLSTLGDITWTANAVGNPTTTAITFTFSRDPGTLVASDFTITPGTGSATRGTLSGSGLVRSLNVSNVTAGTVMVSVSLPWIDNAPQTVTLSVPGDITWTANPVGSPTTTAITFTFSRDPGVLYASDFTITSGTGSATRGSLSGSGLMRTLNVSNVNAGTVMVSVNWTGIVNTPQSVTLSAPGAITWTASPVGSPTTTAINFTFSRDPGTLSALNFSITPGTGSASISSLTGSGLVRTLNIFNVNAGTVMVSVDSAGIVNTPELIALSAVITWTASVVGSPTTTAINFTFSSDPGSLSSWDFNITSGTGSATRGSLSGSGLIRTLTVSNVSAGTVIVSIARTGIANTTQTLTLSAPPTPMTITITGIPLVHNFRNAWVFIVDPVTEDDIAELQGTILNDTLSVTFNNVHPGSYYVDLGIIGGGLYQGISPRSLVAGNNTVPFNSMTLSN